MDARNLRKLLHDLRDGRLTVQQALKRLESLPFESVGFARIDHHRAIRCGFPEVLFCQGKTPEQVQVIFDRLASSGADVLATRADRQAFEMVRKKWPAAEYHAQARAITLRQTRRSARRRRPPAGGARFCSPHRGFSLSRPAYLRSW